MSYEEVNCLNSSQCNLDCIVFIVIQHHYYISTLIYIVLIRSLFTHNLSVLFSTWSLNISYEFNSVAGIIKEAISEPSISSFANSSRYVSTSNLSMAPWSLGSFSAKNSQCCLLICGGLGFSADTRSVHVLSNLYSGRESSSHTK